MPFTCNACASTFEDRAAQVAHYKLDWHRYNLKRKLAGVAPISQPAFERRRAAALGEAAPPAAATPSTAAVTTGVEESKSGEAAPLPADTPTTTSTSTTGAGAGAGAAAGDGSDDEEAGDDLVTVTACNCLFCSKISKSVFKNLAHMASAHSFYIPDEPYLSDLEGLVLYLVEKVYIGNICLYCNEHSKSFPDRYAVQQHMNDKGHNMIRYETDEDVDELAEFFDFTKADDCAAGPAEPVATAVEGGDLVLASGRVLGHRKYRTYYNQKFTGSSLALMDGVVMKPSSILAKRAQIAKRKPVEKFERRRQREMLRVGVKQNKLIGRYFRLQVIQ